MLTVYGIEWDDDGFYNDDELLSEQQQQQQQQEDENDFIWDLSDYDMEEFKHLITKWVPTTDSITAYEEYIEEQRIQQLTATNKFAEVPVEEIQDTFHHLNVVGRASNTQLLQLKPSSYYNIRECYCIYSLSNFDAEMIHYCIVFDDI